MTIYKKQSYEFVLTVSQLCFLCSFKYVLVKGSNIINKTNWSANITLITRKSPYEVMWINICTAKIHSNDKDLNTLFIQHKSLQAFMMVLLQDLVPWLLLLPSSVWLWVFYSFSSSCSVQSGESIYIWQLIWKLTFEY